ncbi:hypothetical protein [Billgrantia kenyensis]|uniref:Uncharacterized protein n=1 Tax=Billgrantia kenyensis TaxID=321266 RepID=A0A7V9W511_9GAMM|nr:hypothetical protein [Halomonas kenyensis]MBA2781115.1 hypothetical protein [Halomonas kenyensis]MCG6659939.1 hypothetical protein [Halomonas kenyensis]
MSQTLTLPASVRDYMLKPGVRTAVDHLLEQKQDHFPIDLQWESMLDYHDGLLMAAKVRRDYVASLHSAWGMIWKEVLVSEGYVREVPFADYYQEALPAPKMIWDDALYRFYSLPGRKDAWLYTAVALTPSDGLVAYIAAEDESEKNLLAEDIVRLQCWIPDEADYWRSKRGAAKVHSDGVVDVSALITAAREVLSILRI